MNVQLKDVKVGDIIYYMTDSGKKYCKITRITDNKLWGYWTYSKEATITHFDTGSGRDSVHEGHLENKEGYTKIYMEERIPISNWKEVMKG